MSPPEAAMSPTEVVPVAETSPVSELVPSSNQRMSCLEKLAKAGQGRPSRLLSNAEQVMRIRGTVGVVRDGDQYSSPLRSFLSRSLIAPDKPKAAARHTHTLGEHSECIAERSAMLPVHEEAEEDLAKSSDRRGSRHQKKASLRTSRSTTCSASTPSNKKAPPSPWGTSSPWSSTAELPAPRPSQHTQGSAEQQDAEQKQIRILLQDLSPRWTIEPVESPRAASVSADSVVDPTSVSPGVVERASTSECAAISLSPGFSACAGSGEAAHEAAATGTTEERLNAKSFLSRDRLDAKTFFSKDRLDPGLLSRVGSARSWASSSGFSEKSGLNETGSSRQWTARGLVDNDELRIVLSKLAASEVQAMLAELGLGSLYYRILECCPPSASLAWACVNGGVEEARYVHALEGVDGPQLCAAIFDNARRLFTTRQEAREIIESLSMWVWYHLASEALPNCSAARCIRTHQAFVEHFPEPEFHNWQVQKAILRPQNSGCPLNGNREWFGTTAHDVGLNQSRRSRMTLSNSLGAASGLLDGQSPMSRERSRLSLNHANVMKVESQCVDHGKSEEKPGWCRFFESDKPPPKVAKPVRPPIQRHPLSHGAHCSARSSLCEKWKVNTRASGIVNTWFPASLQESA